MVVVVSMHHEGPWARGTDPFESFEALAAKIFRTLCDDVAGDQDQVESFWILLYEPRDGRKLLPR